MEQQTPVFTFNNDVFKWKEFITNVHKHDGYRKYCFGLKCDSRIHRFLVTPLKEHLVNQGVQKYAMGLISCLIVEN